MMMTTMMVIKTKKEEMLHDNNYHVSFVAKMNINVCEDENAFVCRLGRMLANSLNVLEKLEISNR